MHKWILIFCLPLASVAEISLCSKKIANLTLVDPMLAERPRKPAGRPIFTKGLDEANRIIQLAKRLRDSQINPHTTHIPEFADDIPKHVSFMKEGVEKSGEEKEAQLKALAELEKEALEKAKNKQVTYEWWLRWNEHLSISSSTNTDADSLTSTINAVITSGYYIVPDIVPRFPDVITIPTTSDFGIQAFNRSLSQNVFPLGVVNQATFADGILMTPHAFFVHDARHSTRTLDKSEDSTLSKIENNFNINLYQELQKLDLSLEQQEMIGLVYFTIWHEQILDIQPVQDRTEPTKFEILLNNRMIRRFQNKNGLGRLLPVSVNADSKEEIEAYLNESIQLFEQLGHQILEAAARTNNPSLTSVES